MGILAAITALLQASTAFLNNWHKWKLVSLEGDIQGIDNEIHALSVDITPANLLRIEQLRGQHKRLCALQSSMRDAD